MALEEGVATRVSYKAHSSGSITPGSEPVLASNPGAASAQELRRVSSTLSLTKDTYQSAEIRSDRQIGDFRHGVKRVAGSLNGELSCKTYQDLMEAASRGTWAAAVSLSNSEFTSVSADANTSKFTFTGGDPVAEGMRVGGIYRFANLSDSDNNNKNFLVLAFGGTSNREVTVYPAPDTMTADSSFTLTGFKKLVMPSSGLVSRLFAIEHYYSTLDIAHLFSECRIGGMNLNLPPTGMATVEFPVMGRNMTRYSGGSAPFFTSPTAATTTKIEAAVNGLLLVGGTAVGVVTGLQLSLNLNPQSEAVVGSNIVPEIFLGRSNLTGTLSAFFADDTLIANFVNETEVSILAYLTGSSDANAQALTFYLPRVKFGGAGLPVEGESGLRINMPFQALKYEGSAAGIENTTLQIFDTEAV